MNKQCFVVESVQRTPHGVLAYHLPDPSEAGEKGLKSRTWFNKGRVYPYASARQNTRREWRFDRDMKAKWGPALEAVR